MPKVDLKLRGKSRLLTCEITRETDCAYEVKYVDRDGKFRFVRYPKTEVEEIRPRLDFS